jgi:hypothetical protein
MNLSYTQDAKLVESENKMVKYALILIDIYLSQNLVYLAKSENNQMPNRTYIRPRANNCH